jgi:tetratricopeptide (TPR) repeat protein
MAHVQLGDQQKAAESLMNAVERNENQAAAHRALADSLERLGRKQEATQYRQRANELTTIRQSAR